MNLFSKDNMIGISVIIVAITACLPHFNYCKNSYFVTVTYDDEKIPLFEHDYNCGFLPARMTERCLEIAIAKIWINKTKQAHEKIIEIGAVTPYYFDKVDDICDPSDPHEKVNIKSSMFNLDLRNKNVLSISTIEHIGLGQYDVPVKKVKQL